MNALNKPRCIAILEIEKLLLLYGLLIMNKRCSRILGYVWQGKAHWGLSEVTSPQVYFDLSPFTSIIVIRIEE
jgi:hypothetical protein